MLQPQRAISQLECSALSIEGFRGWTTELNPSIANIKISKVIRKELRKFVSRVH